MPDKNKFPHHVTPLPSRGDWGEALTENDYHFTEATVWYLEMHSQPVFPPDDKPEASFIILPKPLTTDQYKYYYYTVGFQYNWLDRLAMPEEELLQKINDPRIEIFVMKINNEDAGYAEFLFTGDYAEVVYFGLFPGFVGKGYGKYFLHWVVNKAWAYKPKWIQLNTCSLDHANALPVYKSLGFQVVRTETETRKLMNK